MLWHVKQNSTEEFDTRLVSCVLLFSNCNSKHWLQSAADKIKCVQFHCVRTA